MDDRITHELFDRQEINVLIHPNPASESFRVEFYTDQESKVNLSVTDITGKIVFKKYLENKSGFHTEYIDKSQIGSEGIYFLIVQGENFQATNKLVLLK
ncbi:MAG: T9SS type A sorting domain-containing protein [Saprospiraceae bacterium]|nr:T9SS type A sorting domain-containing protein [Saprospiraceae bacterium]